MIFEIGEKVQIIPMYLPGRIVAILTNEYGTKYDTRYFWEGKVEAAYFYAEELNKK